MREQSKLRFTRIQGSTYLILVLVFFLFLLIYPFGTLEFCSFFILIFYSIIIAHKVIAVLSGILFHDQETVTLDELSSLEAKELPIYTILIPLYLEKEIVATCVHSIKQLDYPRNKLDVKLLLEENDIETRKVIEKLKLPKYFRIFTIPEGKPKTKPRACNYGLEKAKGEFLVIFDAEDVPEPDQLKKAVVVFRRSEKVVGCLQAKLNFYNGNENFLTRWFTLEYSTWFDLFLPGLHAIRCPIPLGGTSNHFKTDVLKAHQGWDSYNVTEDCDLGIELARSKVETRVLDSVTWEECPHQLNPWIKQRSRWVKGYWQTFLAHTRNPFDGLVNLGSWRFLQMLILVGGHVFSMLVNPLTWLILILWICLRWQIFYPESPWTILFFIVSILLLTQNLLFILVHMLAGIQRRLPLSIFYAMTLPCYWLLISIGGWRGIINFFIAPHYWHKTPHGVKLKAKQELTGEEVYQVVFPTMPTGIKSRKIGYGVFSFIILLMFMFILSVVAVYIPIKLKFPEQIRKAAITFDGSFASDIRKMDESWTYKTDLIVSVEIPGKPDLSQHFFKAVGFIKAIDGEWYQSQTDDCQVEGKTLRIKLSLQDGWIPKENGRPWGKWCLRRIKETGIRIYSEKKFPVENIKITKIEVKGKQQLTKLTAKLIRSPKNESQYNMIETDFTLSRDYQNPFDPEEIDLWFWVITPSNKLEKVPAYYHQDYIRKKSGKQEVLSAAGRPHWRVRYTPVEVGTYRWHIVGKDFRGDTLKMPAGIFKVAASKRRGFVRVDPQDQHYFSFSNGDFYYPICLNIRSPGDTFQPYNLDFNTPENTEGTFAMESFLKQMHRTGIDFGRIWMSPWFGSIEWDKKILGYHGLGNYNLQQAWKLDYLLSWADKKNMMIELVLNHHGPFTRKYDSQWNENPYNKINGGPISYPSQILSDATAIKLMKQRLRYISARYGAYPSMFAWVLWIEVNTVSRSSSVMGNWHRIIAPYLQDIDLGRHPVTSEFSSAAGCREVWEIPAIGYTQVAAYNFGNGMVKTFQQRFRSLQRYKKPFLIEEYAGQPNGGSMQVLAHSIHDGLWAGWMMPFAGTPMAWWWNLIFEKKLTRFYTVFREFIAGEDLRGINWQYRTFSVQNSNNIKALGRLIKDRGFLWVYNKNISNLTYHSSRYNKGPQAAHQKFIGIVKPNYNPLTDTAPIIFGPYNNLKLIIDRIEPGTYSVEFWDTWSVGKKMKIILTSTDGKLTIPIPSMTRDLAVKFHKQD